MIGGWTSKITVSQKEEAKAPVPGEDKEGVDPSEWD